MNTWTRMLRELGVAEGGALAHQLREDSLDELGEAFLEQLHAEASDVTGAEPINQGLVDSSASPAVSKPRHASAIQGGAPRTLEIRKHQPLLPQASGTPELFSLSLAASSTAMPSTAAGSASAIGELWINGARHNVFADGYRRCFLLSADGRSYSKLTLLNFEYQLALEPDSTTYLVVGLKQGDIYDVFETYGSAEASARAE